MPLVSKVLTASWKLGGLHTEGATTYSWSLPADVELFYLHAIDSRVAAITVCDH